MGWRTLPTPYFFTLEIHSRDRSQKKLTTGLVIRRDEAFDAWFVDLPNLDAEELAKSEADIAAHLELGVTPEQRSEKLARGHKIARFMN